MKHQIYLLQKKIIRFAVIIPGAILLSLIPADASSQDAVDADPEMPGIQLPVSPVKVDGRILFNVRGLSAYPAELRASAISKRIREAAKDLKISGDSVKIIVKDNYSMIYAGSKFIMNVYELDAIMESVNQDILTTVIKQKTSEAIKSYRNDRSRSMILKKVIYAAGVFIATTTLLLFLIWFFRKVDTWLRKKIKTRIDTVENVSFSLIRSKQLWSTYHLTFNILRVIIIVILITFSLEYILGILPWTSSLAKYVLDLVIDPLNSMGRGIINFLPDLVFLIILYLVTRYLLRLIKLLFSGIQHSGIVIKNFDPDWAMPTYRIVKILVTIFALVIAFPHIPGSGSNAFKGISVFVGLLLSLGSTSFISNLIAGLTITYRRAFKKKDLIQVGTHLGFVENQEILETTLRSFKNEDIIIPNSVLLNTDIKNFSTKARERSLILHTTVGIGYETPWRLVEGMLKMAADRTECLLKDPPPFVLKTTLGDYAITYEINVYCSDASRMDKCYDNLHQNILDVFNENNVQIMTPSYVYDPEKPKVVPKDQWNAPIVS